MTDEARSEQAAGRRGAVLLEMVVLCGLGLAAVFWIIPTQTSGGGLGLYPAFLPTACAVAVTALVFLDGVIRLLKPAKATGVGEPWGALLRIGGISVLGVGVLQFVGAAACGFVVLPAAMIALGERSWVRIIVTTAIGAGGLALIFA